MKFRKIFISVSLALALCFVFNSDAGQKSFRYKKNKPFAGKFKGKLESGGVVYKVKYKVKMSGDDLSGNISTSVNGEDTGYPFTFTGTSSGKVANIVLQMAGGVSPSSQGLTPSDNVKIKLRKKGKKGLKMIYTSGKGGKAIGDWVKYKRLK